MNKKGFSMVEMTISMAILAISVVGLASTTARVAQVMGDAEYRVRALQVVEDRVSKIMLHPVYEQLDSVYSEVEREVEGLPEYTRSTRVTRVLEPGVGEGKWVDFTRITVSVMGPGLSEPVSRTVAMGGP